MNENDVKQLIIEKYGSVNAFSEMAGLANSTVASILDRGFVNAKLKNVFAICKALNIRPDDLDSGFDFVDNSVGMIGNGDNNGVAGMSGSGNTVTINNTEAAPVPVTVHNIDDIAMGQGTALETQEDILSIAKKQLAIAEKQLAIQEQILDLLQADRSAISQKTRETVVQLQQEATDETEDLWSVDGVSHAAAAMAWGKGYEAEEDDRYTVYTDVEPPRHDLAIGVKGDSMMPRYEPGDMLYLVDKGLTSFSGDLCVVAYDGQTYFKKVYSDPRGLRLVSLNKRYADIYIDYPPADDVFVKIYSVVGSFTPIED